MKHATMLPLPSAAGSITRLLLQANARSSSPLKHRHIVSSMPILPPGSTRLSQASNAALALVALGWLCTAYGALSGMGDPAPSVTRAELHARHLVSLSFTLAGFAALIASVWLSGYSFRAAPRRASLALIGCTVPLALVSFAALRFGL